MASVKNVSIIIQYPSGNIVSGLCIQYTNYNCCIVPFQPLIFNKLFRAKCWDNRIVSFFYSIVYNYINVLCIFTGCTNSTII